MNNKKIIKIVLSVVLLAGFVLPVFNYFDSQVLAQTSQQEREALERELRQLEDQLANIENDIEKTEKEKKTLQTEIYLLKRRIQSLNVQIQQSNTMIKDLGYQIEDTEGSIETTTSKMEESKNHLSAILRSIYQEDKKSLVEIFLSENDLSDFFENIIALETLNERSHELLVDIKNLKLGLEDQKELLDEEKVDLERIVKIRILQRQENSVLQNQQEGYLEIGRASCRERV